MEETIIINEQQYQLSYLQPLTVEQRSNIIEQIKKLYGPRGCTVIRESVIMQQMSPMKVLSGNLMALTASCPGGTKQKGGNIALNAAPMGGIAPYAVTYYKKIGTAAPVSIGSQSGVTEAVNATTPSTTTINYTILNDDVKNSTGDPTPNPANPPYVSTALVSGHLRIITQITDSCPTGAQGCIEFCDISLSCAAPACNLIIT